MDYGIIVRWNRKEGVCVWERYNGRRRCSMAVDVVVVVGGFAWFIGAKTYEAFRRPRNLINYFKRTRRRRPLLPRLRTESHRIRNSTRKREERNEKSLYYREMLNFIAAGRSPRSVIPAPLPSPSFVAADPATVDFDLITQFKVTSAGEGRGRTIKNIRQFAKQH